MRRKQQPKYELKIILGILHMWGSCRFWTTSQKPTHCAVVNRCPESPDSVAGIFFKCETEEEAKAKVYEALRKKQYGHTFWYVGMLNGMFGYTVHFPRFKSEKGGFINFHVFKAIEEIPKGAEFKMSNTGGDHEYYRKNFLKKKIAA
jgi:hypothetical protein